MLIAVHNQVTSLSRLSFGPLTLDPALKPGEWRMLTEEEIKALEAAR
jgi:16S rRNA pseudouridine516 synthase